MRRTGVRQEAGFTLTEVLITIALCGVVLGAVMSTFITQRKSHALQEQIAEMSLNARAAMEMVTREFRIAGYSPTGAAFNGVTYHATQLDLRADLDGNGTAGGPDEHVVYSYDAGNLQILRNAGDGAQPLAQNIQAFTFTYLDGTGTPTVVSANIRQVEVTITARTAKIDPKYASNGGYRTYTLTSLITRRN